MLNVKLFPQGEHSLKSRLKARTFFLLRQLRMWNMSPACRKGLMMLKRLLLPKRLSDTHRHCTNLSWCCFFGLLFYKCSRITTVYVCISMEWRKPPEFLFGHHDSPQSLNLSLCPFSLHSSTCPPYIPLRFRPTKGLMNSKSRRQQHEQTPKRPSFLPFRMHLTCPISNFGYTGLIGYTDKADKKCHLKAIVTLSDNVQHNRIIFWDQKLSR